jgi:NADH dehydrogenase FAD-containing subunit
MKHIHTQVKPIDGFSARWDSILDRVRAAADRAVEGAGDSEMTIAVVGGGAGGVELVLSMQVFTQSLHRVYTEFTQSLLSVCTVFTARQDTPECLCVPLCPEV